MDAYLKMKSENETVIKTLKEKLRDVEEELDDVDLEIKKLRRQLRDKTEENGRLIDEVSSFKRSVNGLTAALDSTKNDLAKTSERLDSVCSSLTFVQNILTAPILNKPTLIERDQSINALSRFISGDLQELFKQHFSPNEQADYIFNKGLRQWEAVKRKYWIEKRKNIAFIGEFSAGKTSIVNRILSQDHPDVTLLPVSVKATTAIPTYIVGDDYSTYNFFTPDGILKTIDEEAFKSVSKEILGNITGVSKLIKYFVMTYRNPYLAGMSILDTPGFSSGDEEDAVRTIDVINECDALFWVFDVVVGAVNQSSLDVIKKNMTRPLYVIINKIDLKAKTEVDSIEKQIRKSFKDEGIRVERYLRFSSDTPLDELMKTITSIKNDSSAEQYLYVLTKEFLPSLVSTIEKKHKDSVKAMDASNKKCDQKGQSINQLCRTIRNESTEANEIPQWKSYTFRKNRFEMMESEGKQLKELLEKIAEKDIDNLTKMIEEYGELMQENQSAYRELKQNSITLKAFQDCQSKVKRLIGELKD